MTEIGRDRRAGTGNRGDTSLQLYNMCESHATRYTPHATCHTLAVKCHKNDIIDSNQYTNLYRRHGNVARERQGGKGGKAAALLSLKPAKSKRKEKLIISSANNASKLIKSSLLTA